jgi:membrane-associated phospholipid phosphatase
MSNGSDDDRSVLDRLHGWDMAAYRALARTTTPLLDEPVRVLSTAADYSRISMGSAAVLAVVGGRRGRRAAASGLACVAVASVTVNVGAKLATRRARPDRDSAGVTPDRHVPMPTSTSFPSGHTAAAFAFAAGVHRPWPAASVPLFVLAATVGYSRVHTGVHYPGDVLAGAAIGLVTAGITSRLVHAALPGPGP